jgi:hypothetical protein
MRVAAFSFSTPNKALWLEHLVGQLCLLEVAVSQLVCFDFRFRYPCRAMPTRILDISVS